MNSWEGCRLITSIKDTIIKIETLIGHNYSLLINNTENRNLEPEKNIKTYIRTF